MDSRLSNILEDISGLSIEQRKQVRSVLLAPEMSSEEGITGISKQEIMGVKPSHLSFHMGVAPEMKETKPSYPSFHMGAASNPIVSNPHDHTFHFGNFQVR